MEIIEKIKLASILGELKGVALRLMDESPNFDPYKRMVELCNDAYKELGLAQRS